MCVLAGGDTRRGHYRNHRTTFKGNNEHKELAKKIFPWVKTAEEKISPAKNPIARVFLNLLKNLRWVILQDSAVLDIVYKRTHFFNSMTNMFCSDLFKNFAAKISKHIKETDHVKEDTV